MNGQTAPLLVQLPVLSQTCGWSMLHRLAPGEHATHMPVLAKHAFGQVALVCQLPFASHVCATFPLHWALPGLHTPVQLPALQTNGHAAAFAH
jgi:hypothetical protein